MYQPRSTYFLYWPQVANFDFYENWKSSFWFENVKSNCSNDFYQIQVKLNDTVLFLVGGTTSDANAAGVTYAYDNVDNSWTKGPSLNEPRSGHACGVLRTETENYIVVAGGSTGSNYADTVELLKISPGGGIAEEWVSGPALPRHVLFGSMVEYRLVVFSEITVMF